MTKEKERQTHVKNDKGDTGELHSINECVKQLRLKLSLNCELLNKLQETFGRKCNQGLTAIHLAARAGNPKVMGDLLALGIDSTAQGVRCGNTAWHFIAQGDFENTVECLRELLRFDTSLSVLNSVNNEGQTALHLAIAHKNESMVFFLLNTREGCNLGLRDKTGKTALHYACSGSGENEKSLAILKEILGKCDVDLLNQNDECGQTALHKAAIEGLPQSVSLLLENKEIEVQRKDKSGKSPLHYAAANGCSREGFKCVDMLLRHQFNDEGERLNLLFKDEDASEETPFSLACKNGALETIELFLTSTADPRDWLSDKNIDTLYQKTPFSMKVLMDRSFSRHTRTFPLKRDKEAPIRVDYGPIIGYSDPNDRSQAETKFLFRSLGWRYECQKEILLHPLVELFLLKKSRKLRLFNQLWLTWQIVWLMSYASVGISTHVYPHNSGRSTQFAAGVMMTYVAASILSASYKISQTDIFHVTSYLPVPILQTIFGIITVAPVCTGEEPVKWQTYATTIGALIAYVVTWKSFQKLPSRIGVLIGRLKQVLRQISEDLFYSAPLFVGFTISFMIIFKEAWTCGPVAGCLDQERGDFIYHLIHLTLFFIFVTSIPIGLFNLLTGLALENMSKLEEKVRVNHLKTRVEHIYFMEILILRLRRVPVFNKLICCWRRNDVNVSQVQLDTDPKFQTAFRETIRRPRTDFMKPGLSFQWCLGEIDSYELELSPELIEKIEALVMEE